MATPVDPFQAPLPIASTFASAQSFRGRVVLIEPTGLELDVPSMDNPNQRDDRLTVTVTVLDGLGPVQVFAQRQGTGVMLDGPVHTGVWFSQKRLREGIIGTARQITPGVKVLAVIETYKPGKPQGKGNPWGLIKPTDAQRATAVQIYAQLQVGGAQAPVAQAAPADVAPAPQQQMPAFDPTAQAPAAPAANPFAAGAVAVATKDEPPF